METERTVWPVILGYDETSRVLIAWCELRQGIRHFRTDRVIKAEALTELNGLRPSELRRRWRVWREANHQTRELPAAAIGASILNRTRRRCCSKLPLLSDDRLIGFGAS
jgi:predicted DNA-binding transcriptional regulator YafY